MTPTNTTRIPEMTTSKEEKYWKIRYFINAENRYGFNYACTNNPYKLIKEMNEDYPEVDFEVDSEISKQEYDQSN